MGKLERLRNHARGRMIKGKAGAPASTPPDIFGRDLNVPLKPEPFDQPVLQPSQPPAPVQYPQPVVQQSNRPKMKPIVSPSKLEQLQSELAIHTEGIRDLIINNMLETGLTETECQRVCVLNRLNDLTHVITGILPEDLK